LFQDVQGLLKATLEKAMGVDLKDDEFTRGTASWFTAVQAKNKLTQAELGTVFDGENKYVPHVSAMIREVRFTFFPLKLFQEVGVLLLIQMELPAGQEGE
jgi:hypothetical protein